MLEKFFSLRCPDCGGKITEEERYCPHCGVDLEAPISPSIGSNEDEHSPARQHFKAAVKGYEMTTKAGLRDALVNCDLALQYDPNFADAHNLRGLVLDEMGRLEEAITAYREALRLNPDLGDARINLEDAVAERANNQSEFGFTNEAIGFAEEEKPRNRGFVKRIPSILALLMIFFVSFLKSDLIKNLANAYLLPKTSVVFIPDVPDGIAVSHTDLEEAAQVLSERSQRLGYSNITFEVSTAGEIVGMIPVTMDAVEFSEQVGDVGLLEFVDFGEKPALAGDIIRTDLESKYLQQVDGHEWHTVMSNEGVLSAASYRSQTDFGFQVSFSLNAEGAQIFLKHTSENVGTYLGIVLDKRVVSVPMINQPITDGQGMISGTFTEEEAKELAVILQTKPLPFPVRLR